MTKPTVILAGGGTGGHVFPMIAVAHALRRVRPDIRAVFVGTERGMESRIVPENGFELELLNVLPIRGGGLLGAARGVARAASLLPESCALVEKLGASAVFSLGGYAAGPISLAARTMGLPLALMEPNSVIGLANWLIAPFVQRAYTAFEQTDRQFSPDVVRRLGVPLRDGFQPRPYTLGQGSVRILVLGGSQGAKTLNEVLPGVLRKFGASVQVVHQCGRAHVQAVRERYLDLGVTFARVVPFIDDMPGALGDADLVIGRAGAGAVSEIAAVGRPSVLVPYPFASGDHQRLNAEAMERDGAAICVVNEEATVERMTREIEQLVADRAVLRKMASAAERVGRPNAAEEIVVDFLQMAGLARGAVITGGPGAVRMPYGEVA